MNAMWWIDPERIDELPEPYRSTLELSHYDRMSIREIAKDMNVPVGTVKSRLHRARRRIGTQLPDDTPIVVPVPVTEGMTGAEVVPIVATVVRSKASELGADFIQLYAYDGCEPERDRVSALLAELGCPDIDEALDCFYSDLPYRFRLN